MSARPLTDEQIRTLPDITETWARRLARVTELNRRIDTTGVTRPPRDPNEQEFLERADQEGPFKSKPRTV